MMSNTIYKIAIFGHYGFGEKLYNGQTIKTKTITNELETQLGKSIIKKYDTHGGAKALLRLPIMLFSAFNKAANVLFLPAHNGVKIIIPLAVVTNLFFHRRIHYIVIGGWLPELIKDRAVLKFFLKKVAFIYVETQIMANQLKRLGLDNIVVMPNCKKLDIVCASELNALPRNKISLCTFSRVMKEKGIQDAIDAVESVNRSVKDKTIELDIYGPVDNEQIEWFKQIQENMPKYIHYNGKVEADKSVSVLKQYFALLFPTHFFTEGIPGTIIDAYAAGVPVICSKWESFSDVVDEGITGYGYDFNNPEKLTELLQYVVNNQEKINGIRHNCINKASMFLPSNVLQILLNNLI